MRNTLFQPFKRNHTAKSKPLGTWTTQQNAQAQDDDEEDEDE